MTVPPELHERLFRGFTPEEAESILGRGVPRHLRRGQILFREGEPANALYAVELGRIKLIQLAADGQRVIMRFLAPGDAFAAVALFDGSVYPVTAESPEHTRVWEWPREVLPGLVREHPRFEANLLQIVSSHTREVLSRVRELATEPVARRLARGLLRLGHQIGRLEPSGSILIERIVQQDLAEITGTSVYTVSRTLADWQELRIVETGRQRVRILDPQKFTEIAEGCR